MREVRRAVVKIGTNTICQPDGTVDLEYISGVARQTSKLLDQGVEVLIVSSGAIGSGSSELGLDGVQKSVAMKQACAAVGQGILMMAWRDAFRLHGRSVGQILLTYSTFTNRSRYIALGEALEELFRLGAVPVINENDVISTDEIDEKFGDNDKLSALVASKTDADLLVLLTDVDGLYDRNPAADPDAKLIPVVDEINEDIRRMAGGSHNERATGGMRTKIGAAEIAMASGTDMIIANGRVDDVILRAVNDRDVGTLFTSSARYTNKERWILFALPRGLISVDQGAEAALRSGRSLLPCGITSVEGDFERGDVIRIGGFAKGVASCSAQEARDMMASRERGSAVVEHSEMVFLSA